MPEQDLQPAVAHDRGPDELEALSIKYNVARIVRLSSGNFALFSHYRAGTMDLIKVGTIEEIVGLIPSADECVMEAAPTCTRAPTLKDVSSLLADIGF